MPKKKSKPKAGAADSRPTAAEIATLQDLNEARSAAKAKIERARKQLAQLHENFERAEEAFVAEGRRLKVLPGDFEASRAPTEVVRSGPPPETEGPRTRGGETTFANARGADTVRAPAAEQPRPTTELAFADFLSGVSEAMITAQQRLDLQTEAYLAGGSSDRPLPTLFRLPRLKAEVKFALETTGANKLNLLFYSSSSAATSMQQHSMEFDLIAVPPPVESGLVAGKYIPLMPRLELIFDRSARLRWLDAMLGNADVRKKLGLPNDAFAGSHPELLLWRFIQPKRKETDSQLFLLGISGTNEAGLVFVEANRGQEDATPTVKAVQGLALDAVAGWLREFLLEAGQRQRELLTGKATDE